MAALAVLAQDDTVRISGAPGLQPRVKELVMALLDRVATLVRANLNDLIDKAENPEKMLKQVILDMENQFMQVKTQVAIALADLHLLQKKKQDNTDKHADWMRKAELAVDKQEAQVESLKAALKKLEIKLSEARAKVDLLIAQHRRSRIASRAAEAQVTPEGENRTFDRMRNKVAREQAIGEARSELLGDDIEGRFHALEREEKVDALLAELKQRKRLSA